MRNSFDSYLKGQLKKAGVKRAYDKELRYARLDLLAEQTIRAVEDRRSKMTPAERARCDKKTLEIAARISARRKRTER